MRTAPDLDPAVLLPPFACWLPDALRRTGERELFRFHGLTRETYSTRRFLSHSPDGKIGVLKAIPAGGGKLLLCEAGSAEVLHYSAERGLKLAGDGEGDRATGLIEAALRKVVEPFPFLGRAVSELAWRCHILRAPDDDYDVSFSDPAIPFSVFISVPDRDDERSVLRVAENLIHETMHLQLTLFESLCPLVDTESAWSVYSPWKHQERPAQGVLHGLYVFCVLRWIWQRVSQENGDMTAREFALRRVAETEEEIFAAGALEESAALTAAGRHLVRKLLAG